MEENHRFQFHGLQGVMQLVGAGLVVSGGIFLLGRYLNANWLALTILPLFGIAFLVGRILRKNAGLLIAGSVLTGLGIGAFVLFAPFLSFTTILRVGYLISAFGLSWLLVAGLLYLNKRTVAWWAILIAMVFMSLGLCFTSSALRVVDFVLYLSLGVGIALLAWGVFSKLFGLIIPGALISTIGLGIYLAWSGASITNGLAHTGIMLVWFALGWMLITVFSRVITTRFVWWPLIPGGILGVVGWGLYIGGNPSNALTFISNTGSIAMIIIGAYLLLLRQGIHR